MNVIERVKETLPAWLTGTPTGKKILAECTEAELEATQATTANRSRLAVDLKAALKTEREDPRLIALREKQRKLIAEVESAKAVIAAAPGTLVSIQTEIEIRTRAHREASAAIWAQMGSAPDWADAVIDDFVEKLQRIQGRVAKLKAEPLDKQIGLTAGGHEKVVKVFDLTAYRVAMIGTPANPLNDARSQRTDGWIQKALIASKKLRREILTPEELDSRIREIWSTQPQEVATWRAVA